MTTNELKTLVWLEQQMKVELMQVSQRKQEADEQLQQFKQALFGLQVYQRQKDMEAEGLKRENASLLGTIQML